MITREELEEFIEDLIGGDSAVAHYILVTIGLMVGMLIIIAALGQLF